MVDSIIPCIHCNKKPVPLCYTKFWIIEHSCRKQHINFGAASEEKVVNLYNIYMTKSKKQKSQNKLLFIALIILIMGVVGLLIY